MPHPLQVLPIRSLRGEELLLICQCQSMSLWGDTVNCERCTSCWKIRLIVLRFWLSSQDPVVWEKARSWLRQSLVTAGCTRPLSCSVVRGTRALICFCNPLVNCSNVWVPLTFSNTPCLTQNGVQKPRST